MTFHQFAYRNVVRNFRIYAAFFMASFFSVFVFFIYSMLMFHQENKDGYLGKVPIGGLVFAEMILVLFSWFFIFYSMKAFLESRSKEFAILIHLGMEKRQFARLIFLETMLIGSFSIACGIFFGYAFTKYFFMIVREILMLEQLPLYFKWEPFLLTIAVYFSAFVIISVISIHVYPKRNIIDLLKWYRSLNINDQFSKKRAILAILLLCIGYGLALLTNRVNFYPFVVLLPILITIGTYFFFTDAIPYFVHFLKRRKNFYWKKTRMLSVAEQTFIMKNNGKMFFVVTMVSTAAFLCIGLLAALSSYTSQYDKLNPLGLIYKGHMDNPYEKAHITSIVNELERKGLSYHLTRFKVKKQTSSFTNYEVEVFRESDINSLLFSYGYPMVRLDRGEGMFIPYSEDAIKKLSKRTVYTVLKENNVPITINRVYPKVIFPSSIVSPNAIIISDEDFSLLKNPYFGYPDVEPGYHLFAFDIPQWLEAQDVGLSIYQEVQKEYSKDRYELPFYFENAGLNYSYVLSMYWLFTLVGLLVAGVFLLAAGSFIYFKIHTNLVSEKRKFDVLKRMGITDSEIRRLVTTQLLPQFFLPWGAAMSHSLFAFLALQNLLKDIANISIVKEIIFAFSFLILLQVIYFYLIRWRYIAHVKN